MVLPKVFFVYILRSENDGNFYTGITNNLKQRIKEHNSGKISTPSTKDRKGFKLVYYEIHKSGEGARLREKFWKGGYGRGVRDSLFK